MNASCGFNKLVRGSLLAMWGFFHVILLCLMVAMAQTGVLREGWWMLLLLSAIWSGLLYFFIARIPDVSLTENGVLVRVLVRKRLYRWSEVKQAGVLYRWGRYTKYNSLVLLKPNGSPRRYQDKTFVFRNLGKLIEIANTENNRRWIIRHYGPLDFDLSDGREEKSIVID